ncbi:CBS domain-containing protein [Thalassotalea fonticola]|uniref:CBS domain-containing protein n=1 Tax=Thalassotalea fonticola TaxID=3065649 RepID=A0ABZ0GL87_9GAMM|nr:CBS domain-containing protein [Colwelliaceae bacterium S1-1]
MGSQALSNSTALSELSNFSLTDIISKNVLTVYEGWSVKRLASFFVKHRISGAPVIAADDELVGVVTQSDVIRFESRTPTEVEMQRLAKFYCGPYGGELSDAEVSRLQDKANEYCTVNSIMTHEVLSLDSSSSVSDTCSMITKHDIHRIFITENNCLVGVVTAMDILKKLSSQ